MPASSAVCPKKQRDFTLTIRELADQQRFPFGRARASYVHVGDAARGFLAISSFEPRGLVLAVLRR
jgi:hypothetical protein